MLLLLLLPEKWLQFGKRIDYCLGILAPEIKNKIRMADGNKRVMGSAKTEGVLTCFRRVSSILELVGTRGCDEELGIVVFGWPSNSDSAWSTS